jgi:septal ring factor EnvC (AmiA/AmiB activator)
MKKILLVFLLLVLVVAVSYIKTVRDQANRQKSYDEGLNKGEAEATVYAQQADSLKELMAQSQAEFADSTASLTQVQSAEADSLRQVIADQQQALQKATAKKKSAVKSAPKPKPADTLRSSLNHAEILAFYKRKLEELPRDLTDYEKRVAVNEVREETVKKFAITLTQLEQLRKANNLSE